MREGTAAVVHMLARLTFGVRADDFERVAEMGTEAWFDQQLDPDTIDDAVFDAAVPDDPVPPASFESMEEARRFGREVVNIMTTAKLLGTVYSERQRETVLLDFCFNHFNVCRKGSGWLPPPRLRTPCHRRRGGTASRS